MVVSTCRGCKTHRTLEEFRELKHVGTTDFSETIGEPHILEFRNCDCKSTLSIRLNEDGSLNNSWELGK